MGGLARSRLTLRPAPGRRAPQSESALPDCHVCGRPVVGRSMVTTPLVL
jgi:hypothetical protein